MVRFMLYCTDHPNGLLLASCVEGVIEYHLTYLFKDIYSPGRFQVTVKKPYKQEEAITRFDRDFIEAYPNIGWLPRPNKLVKRGYTG